MVRLCSAVGFAMLLGVFLVGTGRPDEQGEPRKQPTKQFQVPQGWGKLGLSIEQKKKIYATRASFYSKIQALEDQIDQLKKNETQELVKILTEGQREKLRKRLAEKFPDVEKKAPDKKGSTDKTTSDKKTP